MYICIVRLICKQKIMRKHLCKFVIFVVIHELKYHLNTIELASSISS